MSIPRERMTSEYESKYGRRLWGREARKNYHRLANERKDRVLNAMRHQPIHWDPKILHVKKVDGTVHTNKRISSSQVSVTEKMDREDVVKCKDQVPKSQSALEVDQKRKGSPISNSNCKCCQRSCPNLSPQNVVNSSSNQESGEWLVHIDFDPEKKADKDCSKDIQTIKVTTTRINQEATETCVSEKDKKLQSAKEKSRSSSPAQESKPQTPTKPSSSGSTQEKSQETLKTEEKASLNLSEEEKRNLIVSRLLRPMLRSAPPVRPKPDIKHQISNSKYRGPVVWENTQPSPSKSTPEANKFYSMQTTQNQTASAAKHPPFAMYGGNDNGIRQTYNVKPNSKEVHPAALRAKKERERLQIFRKDVEKKKPPMIKQPRISMKLFCGALCAQNKPRETDSWSTEYKRNFTSSYDFTPKKPVFKVIKESEKPVAVSKFLG